MIKIAWHKSTEIPEHNGKYLVTHVEPQDKENNYDLHPGYAYFNGTGWTIADDCGGIDFPWVIAWAEFPPLYTPEDKKELKQLSSIAEENARRTEGVKK